MTRTKRLVRPFLVATALVGLSTGGCGDSGSDATTGRRVVLHTRLAADPEIGETFKAAGGWSVTLSQALVATGGMYYFDGEPAFVQAAPQSVWRGLASLVVGTAQAHPGHYIQGNAIGEMLAPFSADLLAGPVALPDGEGITGPVRSATFSLASPSAGPVASALDGHAVLTRGRAVKGDQAVYFELAVDLPEIADNAKNGGVAGCVFEETELEGDATVEITVLPHVWFELVDFTGVAPGTAETPTAIGPEATPHIAFALGLVQLSAYRFAIAP